MSFSRGLNTGFSIFTDMAKISMAKERAELDEMQTFGFYSDAKGEKVDRENAFGEDGELLEGFKFTPGTAQVQEERFKQLQFTNSPEMQDLAKNYRELQNNNLEENIQTRSLMNRKNMQEQLGTELFNFYSGFNVLQDAEQWNSLSQKKKDFFINTQAGIAQGIKEFYGVDPLAIFDDKVISGYETAARLQDQIIKDPSSFETLDLNDYSSGLNALFDLQTSKFVGKKFESGERSGTVQNVDIDFTNYKIDPDGQVILNAVYDVKFDDDTVEKISGVLNDTDRDVIRPSIEAKDAVALSLNDLLDYTSAGASVLGAMSNSENRVAFEVASEANLRRASMFDNVDLGTAVAFEQKVDQEYSKQFGQITNLLRSSGFQDTYVEFFTAPGTRADNLEQDLISIAVNNFSPRERDILLEKTEDSDSGFKLRRGEDGKPIPLYDLKFDLAQDKAVIRETLLGNTNLNNNAFINPQAETSFSFRNLTESISLQTSPTMIETLIDERQYKYIEDFLANNGQELTTANIIPLLIEFEKLEGGVMANQTSGE